MKQVGLSALISMISNFFFIGITFFALQSLRLDYFINQNRQNAFKFVLILLSVAIGYLVSQFFLNFIDNVRNLIYLV